MEKGVLYNSCEFPNYIFYPKVKRHLFFEFDFIFTDEFVSLFKKYLLDKQISKIKIENLEPKGFPFNEEILTQELSFSFIKIVCEERNQNYVNVKASFFMLCEKGLIYSPEHSEVFCIFLERNSWIAVLGFTDEKDVNYFNGFEIKNLQDYLKLRFNDNDLPHDFKEILLNNWGRKNN